MADKPLDTVTGVIRLLSPDADVEAGLGFLTAGGVVVVAAHSVNVALRRPVHEATAPLGAHVLIEFPLAVTDGVAPSRRARVIGWKLESIGGLDLALLTVVAESAPERAQPMRLRSRAQDQTVVVFGYPSTPPRVAGLWARYSVVGLNAAGLLQLDSLAESSVHIQPGFSGSPLVDKATGDVVGIVVAAPADSLRLNTDAYAIDAETIVAAFPEFLELVGGSSPYRGLMPFREDDAKDFYGRTNEARAVSETIEATGASLVIGASGTGKSSLILAGVLPLLRQRRTLHLLAVRPGSKPLHALAGAMISNDESGAPWEAVSSVVRELRKNGVRDVLAGFAAAQKSDVLLFCDQMEELFTHGASDEDIDALVGAAIPGAHRADRVFAVTTIRSDFIEELLRKPAVADRLRTQTVFLGPMDGASFRDVVECPAAARGVKFEAGLVDRLVADAGTFPGSLPLLEFALQRLWLTRHGRTITHDDYGRVGSVAGALDDYAEDWVQQFLRGGWPEETIDRILLRLVATNPESAAATKKVAARSDFSESEWGVIRAIADARLAVVGHSVGSAEASVELAHEALLSSWRRLARLVDADRDFLKWRSSLETIAALGDLSLPPALVRESSEWLAIRRSDVPADVVRLIEQSARRLDGQISEIHWRINNNLQILTSILALQSRRADSVEARDLLEAAVRRVRPIAITHLLLSRSGTDVALVPADVLDGILEAETRAASELSKSLYERATPTFQLVGTASEVPADEAVRVAVIVNELLTNAVEHGPDPRHETALVRLSVGSQPPSTFVVTVENSLPEHPRNGARGLGLQVVEALASGVGGSVSIARKEVWRVDVVLPLGRPEAVA